MTMTRERRRGLSVFSHVTMTRERRRGLSAFLFTFGSGSLEQGQGVIM